MYNLGNTDTWNTKKCRHDKWQYIRIRNFHKVLARTKDERVPLQLLVFIKWFLCKEWSYLGEVDLWLIGITIWIIRNLAYPFYTLIPKRNKWERISKRWVVNICKQDISKDRSADISKCRDNPPILPTYISSTTERFIRSSPIISIHKVVLM